MEMSIFSAAIILWFVMDPLGNVPLFLTALNKCSPDRRRIIVVREVLIALGVMLVFMFIGEYLMNFLHIKREAINVGGGIILFLIALNMVFPKEGGLIGPATEAEPFIVPLAIPLVAGPSTLATILLLVKSDPSRIFEWLLALLAAWAGSSVVLISATFLYKFLRPRGLIALERLMGMLLVIMSVQMFLDGLKIYLS